MKVATCARTHLEVEEGGGLFLGEYGKGIYIITQDLVLVMKTKYTIHVVS